MSGEKCWECGATMQQKTKPYAAEAKLDGTLHRFHVPELPYWGCNNCGEEGYDDTTNDAITDALTAHIGKEGAQ